MEDRIVGLFVGCVCVLFVVNAVLEEHLLFLRVKKCSFFLYVD